LWPITPSDERDNRRYPLDLAHGMIVATSMSNARSIAAGSPPSLPDNVSTNPALSVRRSVSTTSLLRPFCRALSHHDYDQLGALQPGLGLARPLWRTKELRARQPLHDLPPMVASWLADND